MIGRINRRFSSARLAPFDCAESGTSEEDIHQADCFDSLVPEIHSRIMGIPMRNQVPERDPMLFEDPDGQRGVSTQYIFISLWLGRQQAADIIFSPGEINHGSVAEDQAEGKQGLRRDSIVIIPLFRALDATGRSISGTA